MPLFTLSTAAACSTLHVRCSVELQRRYYRSNLRENCGNGEKFKINSLLFLTHPELFGLDFTKTVA